MIKILFVTNFLSVGGVEKALINLVNALDKNKYDITVLSIMRDFTLRDQLNSNVKVKAIFPKKMKGIDYLFKYIPTNFLYRLFIRERYDIEIAFSDGKPVVLLGLNTISKSKKFTWIHQDVKKYDKVINCYKSWDEYKESYKNFNKVFCVSQQVNESFIDRINSTNSCVMYNVMPKDDIIRQSKEEIRLQKGDKPVIVNVGRLSTEKGQMRLLKIHKALLTEGYLHHIWLIGDGPDKDDIVKYIRDNNLQDSVYLFGYQSNPYKYIINSDLYVCPSYTEALSTTCIESLILDVPVVTTNVPGSQDILGNSNAGVIVENSDESLYSELKKILIKPDVLKEFQKNIMYPKKKFNDQLILTELETLWVNTV